METTEKFENMLQSMHKIKYSTLYLVNYTKKKS